MLHRYHRRTKSFRRDGRWRFRVPSRAELSSWRSNLSNAAVRPPPYSVLVAPLPTTKFEFGAAAIALFSDPDTNKPAAHRVLGELYALTPAEIMVATKLAEGRTLRTISEEFGLLFTRQRAPKSKLSFLRLSTHRQAELVALIARLSNSV